MVKQQKEKDQNQVKKIDDNVEDRPKTVDKGKSLAKGGEVHSHKNDPTMNDIFKLLQESKICQDTLLKKVEEQGQNLEGVVERVQNLEYWTENPEMEYEVEGDVEGNGGDCEGQADSGEPVTKKQKVDDNEATVVIEDASVESKFKTVLSMFQKTEKKADAIDTELATAINEVFLHGMDKSAFDRVTKDVNFRPENCAGLRTVKVNPLIFEKLPGFHRGLEERMQEIQKSIVKAGIILTRLLDSKETPENLGKLLLEKGLDALMLLGHANANFQWRRREILRNHIERRFHHLCGTTVDFTDMLFGDDLNKTVTEINQMNRVTGVVGRGSFRGGF